MQLFNRNTAVEKTCYSGFTGYTDSYSLSVFYIPFAWRPRRYRRQTGNMDLYPLWKSWIKNISFCHFCWLADTTFWLSLLFTNRKINIGTDMGKISTNKMSWAFSFCNLFFKMSKTMKHRRQTGNMDLYPLWKSWIKNIYPSIILKNAHIIVFIRHQTLIPAASV
jgi:hypothetical protein